MFPAAKEGRGPFEKTPICIPAIIGSVTMTKVCDNPVVATPVVTGFLLPHPAPARTIPVHRTLRSDLADFDWLFHPTFPVPKRL